MQTGVDIAHSDHGAHVAPYCLKHCAAALASELGPAAPAYITLRRWQKDGLLDDARVELKRRGKDLFRLDVLVRIAHERSKADRRPPIGPNRLELHQSPSAPNEGPNGVGQGDMNRTRLVATASAAPASSDLVARSSLEFTGDAAALTSAITDLRAQVAGLGARLEEQAASSAQLLILLTATMNAAANLDATRKSLMAKYDAVDQSLRAKVADLERENATLRTAANPIEVRKLNILLSRVSDALAACAP